MNRPTGVTIIAVLSFLGAILCVLAGIGMIAGGGFLATMMSHEARGGAAAGLIASMGAVVGVICLAFAAVYILLGWGLWVLKEWARILAIVLAAIAALFQLPGLMGALIHFNIALVIWAAFWLAVDIVIIVYLLKPEIKAAFRSGQVTPATT